MSDAEIARKIGVDKSSISQWGKNGLPKTLGNVLRILNEQQPSVPLAKPAQGMMPVKDRRLAEILALLADEWEALNPHGRAQLAARFETAFPELRGGARWQKLSDTSAGE